MGCSVKAEGLQRQAGEQVVLRELGGLEGLAEHATLTWGAG